MVTIGGAIQGLDLSVVKESLEVELSNNWGRTPATLARYISGGSWKLTPHLAYITEHITPILHGGRFVIVSMPPGHGKSELHSLWTPTWFLHRRPGVRVGLVSYAGRYASVWGRRVRDTFMTNPILGDVRRNVSAAWGWELMDGGSMVTSGVGGSLTGRRLDLLVIDDPIKNYKDANSPDSRESLWRWWETVARTRLEPNGSILIVMTRWHEDDMVGRLIAQDGGDPWEYIRLPAIAEADDPLGRREGESLWPYRYNESDLERVRVQQGPVSWACMYQQDPIQQEGNIFKTEWWNYLDDPPVYDAIFQYWDTAYKTGMENDFSVCVTMAPFDKGYYLIDVYRERLEYPDLLRAMKTQYAKWNPSGVFVEDRASGQSVVQSIRRETRIPILPSQVDVDKVLRANRVTGMIEAGRVYMPMNEKWLPAFLGEMSSFPLGTFDDQVDAFVGCMEEMIRRSGAVGTGWAF